MNFVEFKQWKEQYEKNSNSWFVQGSGKKSTTLYFYCNRSGHYQSKGAGKRHIKNQGSSKINGHCTAAMVAKLTESLELEVTIYKNHYGHKTSLGHLRIPETDRLAIAGKLSQGVDFQRILDEVRDKLGSSYHRIHLLTRKDIDNIDKTYCLHGIQRHKDDATSVNLWVQQMRTQDDNPVLLYKIQGDKTPANCPGLADQDFVLAIQTPLQASMLKQFGTNVICIDGTHGTNGYNFTLVTVMVVDEYGEGLPVAWCISNREDYTVLVNFFRAIRNRVGAISASWFMSDIAEQYYSAWLSSFSDQTPPKRLLCAWHVDRAWRESLKHIKDVEVKVNIYHNLRVLMEETERDKFELLLAKTLSNLQQSQETANFGTYFQQYYGNKKELWAACYRRDSPVNTNMYVEAFHRVLKYVYLKGKINKRLDKCVGILLKLARDKGFQRLHKLEKGKNTARIQQIMESHKVSLKMDPEKVKPTEEYLTWGVVSSDKTNTYHVTQINQHCSPTCSLRCEDCGICIHTFACNCPDALIRANICKHIHLVARFVNRFGRKAATSVDLERGREKYIEWQEADLLDSLPHTTQQTCPQTYKEGIQQTLSTIAGSLNNINDIDLLKDVKSLLNSAWNIIKARKNHVSLPVPNKKDPPNKKISTQRSFFSTKKKRNPPTVRLAKPTQKEKSDVISFLIGQKATLCPLKHSIFRE